ncbi:MarR family transcriptional regulator [Amycolatopsis sp. NPDC088138]|uniref:MarR family transcriptional regulator n=1 Tax=Amycolatopsis sp. NPDC088138 TaxID=3363938 RepID=UPI003823A3E8
MTREPQHPVPDALLDWFSTLCRDTATLLLCRDSRRSSRSVTERHVLNVAASHPPGTLTAGRIARLTGLSTGAVTGVLDRLERAGFVRRARDRDDRRKVLVELLPGGAETPASTVLRRVLEDFSPAERAVVERFTIGLRRALFADLQGEEHRRSTADRASDQERRTASSPRFRRATGRPG